MFHKENKNLREKCSDPNRMNILTDAFQAGGMTPAGLCIAHRRGLSASARSLSQAGPRAGAGRESGCRMGTALHAMVAQCDICQRIYMSFACEMSGQFCSKYVDAFRGGLLLMRRDFARHAVLCVRKRESHVQIRGMPEYKRRYAMF